jgi:hypothetical protein
VLSLLQSGGLSAFPSALLAHNYVSGQISNVDFVLNDPNNWQTIRSVTVVIAANDPATHSCVATASADMFNASRPGVRSKYLFVLSRNNNNPSTNGGSERSLELATQSSPHLDPESKPVSTTIHSVNLTNSNGVNGGGTHTFYFLGRYDQGSPSWVLDGNVALVCVETP